MEVSVLISTYKNDNLNEFETAVSSIFNQTLLPKQIVLVIDGQISEEHSNLINKLKNIFKNEFLILKLEKNMGLAFALNMGIKKCKYNYIARMDSDDFSLPNRFEKQINYLIEKELDVVACLQAEFTNDKNEIVSFKETPEDHYKIKSKLEMRNIISHPSLIFKKDSLLAVSGYRITVGLFEDYDLHLRMIHAGFTYGCIQDYLVRVRVSEKQRVRRGGLKNALDNAFLRYKWYKEGYISFKYCVLTILSYSIFTLAPSYIKKYLYSLVRKKRVRK